MDQSLLAQLGVGGIFSILMVREVLKFLRERQQLKTAPDQNDCHNWKSEIEKTLYKLSVIQEQQTKILERIEIQLARAS